MIGLLNFCVNYSPFTVKFLSKSINNIHENTVMTSYVLALELEVVVLNY